MNCTRSLCNICKESISLLIRQLNHLADVLVMSKNQTTRMALLLKYIQKTGVHLANRICKLCNQFSLHTICAIYVFHVISFLFSYFDPAITVPSQLSDFPATFCLYFTLIYLFPQPVFHYNSCIAPQ